MEPVHNGHCEDKLSLMPLDVKVRCNRLGTAIKELSYLIGDCASKLKKMVSTHLVDMGITERDTCDRMAILELQSL